MTESFWIIPALPFLGFLLLSLFGHLWPKNLVATIGAGSVGFSAFFTIILSIYMMNPSEDIVQVSHNLWDWMEVQNLKVTIGLKIDALTLVFMFVITFVGFLIHLYSTTFMKEEEGYARFFSYMNLFIGSMLVLVMADNLLLLYLGWEGVGLCSYLLIGFWYQEKQNNYAARKAFIITRIGDTAMAIGLFLLFHSFQTLNISEINARAPEIWSEGSKTAVWAAFLLLAGALGKSAQLPFHTWLPDAMAGPSPVSALIHAATMVTAGVYLIARMHVIFALAPTVQFTIAVIGAITLVLAGFSALVQRDIKRVLAYSTISQIGYMFLALGVGAWSAGIFHFMTHSFFKALLFLGSGVIILKMHHEHDMFNMGGLRKHMPLTFITFLIGSASLAALPLITAGFYSKDMILWEVWSSQYGGQWLWAFGFIGAFITALYTFRMVFVTFFGENKRKPESGLTWNLSAPLIILAILSLFGGLVEIPATIKKVSLFSGFLGTVFPEQATHHSSGMEMILQILTSLVILIGIGLAYVYFTRNREKIASFRQLNQGGFFYDWWHAGWGFDALYDLLFAQPIVYLARINRHDFIDKIIDGISSFFRKLYFITIQTQTGKVRWYLMSIAIGAIVSLTIMLIL